jgi:pimeloyl-ACP methyl ester carboxylesterase
VVFIHGLGVGFAAYMRLISHLPRDVDVFLLEWPHVSMHMAEEVPTIQQTKDCIASVLAAYGHKRACFVGHSLGTTCIAWLLRDPATAHLVGSSVIIDPVTFLLLHPKVATSFVYHNPVTPVEFALHFFVARELYISHAISRHFNWAYNIMFAEDLLMVEGIGIGGKGRGEARGKADAERQIRHTVLLSSEDSLVPVEAVVSYLRNKEEEFRRDGTDCFETVVFDGQHHGEMMLYPSMMRVIEERIRHRMRVPLSNI